MRKTKRRVLGGAQTVFVCKSSRTSNEKCINDFEDETGFQFIDVEGDGNCFFHTMAMFYRFNGNESKTQDILRQQLVKHMLDHYADYEPYGITKEEIEDFRKDGTWNNDVGDLVVPAAATAFNIRIKLYDLKPATKVPPARKRIILHTYPEEGNYKETAHILRVNKGHFGFLVDSSSVKIIANKTNKISIVENKNANPSPPPPPPSVRTRSKGKTYKIRLNSTNNQSKSKRLVCLNCTSCKKNNANNNNRN
jgi:hypothetical protein